MRKRIGSKHLLLLQIIISLNNSKLIIGGCSLESSSTSTKGSFLKCLVPTSCSLNKDRLPVQRLYERLVRGELRRGELHLKSAVLVQRLQLGGRQVQGDGDLQRGVEKAKVKTFHHHQSFIHLH